MNLYETGRLLSEYLLFHYANPEEILPWSFGPTHALGFPIRSVAETFAPLPKGGRALDLGCSVGRSTFELARHCDEVIGIDFSRNFIEAATKLKQDGEIAYQRIDEGSLSTSLTARVPSEIDRARVHFEIGDAMALRKDLGNFDAVLAANLLCRLSEPRKCLAQMAELVRPGGTLVITTPCTWMDEFTARDHWLGGLEREGIRVTTLSGIRSVLEADFELQKTCDLPFLIREHARKYQWSVAQASVWKRKE